MEELGKYKGSTVFLDYDSSKAPFMWIVWCRCGDIFNGHGFPTEEEARAFAAGRYHLPAEECSGDPYMNWPDDERPPRITGTAHWPEHRKMFTVFTAPDGKWSVGRGDQGYLFDTEAEALAFAAGRNWSGIKWYRSAREEGADDEQLHT